MFPTKALAQVSGRRASGFDSVQCTSGLTGALSTARHAGWFHPSSAIAYPVATLPRCCQVVKLLLTSLQDQLRALRELVAAAFGSGGEEGLPAVEIYDGDTPMGER